MENFGKFCAGLILVLISILLRGFVIMKIWGWILLDIFKDIPKLSLVQAIGFSIFISLFTYHLKEDDKNNDKSFWEKIFITICVQLLYLLSAYLVSLAL